MMKKRNFVTFLSAVLIMVCTFLTPVAENKARLVHNTLDEINACKGKLKMKLVRVWGGDEEEDEKKFFRTPNYVAVDKKGDIYISDRYNHHIKVFDRDGKYLRTIGRKGRGPGDLHRPRFITFSPEGDLVVLESGSRRIQYFSPPGKSKKIRRQKGCVHWFGITSKNQLLVYDEKKTFKSRTLVSMKDEKGKSIRDIGVFHDTSKSYLDMERLRISLDGRDNIIVANASAPVIRIYNPEGEMTLAITYDTPFNLPVEVNINKNGDEIEIKRPANWGASKLKKMGHSRGIAFQRIRTRGILEPICKDIGIDAENRIYLLALKRERTLEEFKKIPVIISGDDTFKVVKRDLPLDREMDHLRILVFDPRGNVIAEAPVTKECSEIIVSGNRLFITDPFFNKRILEYEIQIKDRDRGVER